MDHSVTVLEALRQHGRASRAELATATGLSVATVSRAIAKLRREKLVEEEATVATPVGRPPRVVVLRSAAARVVGIDVGGSRIRAVLADLDGAVRASATSVVRDPANGRAIVETIRKTVERVAGRAPKGGPVLAAAAGISGIVDSERGEVLLAPDLPGLQTPGLRGALQEALGLPVAIDNDDLLAAVGEATLGAALGCADVVFLSLGYGLGAGLIVGGRPVRGSGSAAGAVGFFAPGRLENRASGRVIPARYAGRIARARGRALGTRSLAKIDAEEVFRRAANGDGVAAALVHDVVSSIGDLVVNVAALLDPEVAVLGGGLALSGPSLVEPIVERLRATVPHPPRLVVSALGEDAVARGAAVLAVTLAKQQLTAGDAEPSEPPHPGRIGAIQLA